MPGKTDSDCISVHEDLESRPPTNLSTGYAAIPQNDPSTKAQQTETETETQTQHFEMYKPILGSDSEAPLLPALPAGFHPHIHCEKCTRYHLWCGLLIAAVLIVAIISGLVLGIVVTNAKKTSSGYWH
ncbi:hypothetical protein BJX76DRAFT_139676 [Aspergillus varians]